MSVADVPLFKVAAKGSVVYAQSLQEAEALLRKQHKRLPPTTVSRFKGLGEMNPKELHRFILNPETRQLRVIQPPVDSNAEQHIRLLLGKDGEYRKTVVAE
jgi:DNA gyrase/topoisomerase IV subunit B